MKISQERQNVISRLIAAGSPKSEWCQNAEEFQFWDMKVSEYVAAKNRSTPAFILAKLAQDAVENLRWRVATNRSTPIEVLNELVRDKHEYVKKCAIENLAVRIPLSELSENDQDGWRLRAKLYLASDSQTPVGVLTILAQQSEISVLAAVASNPSTALSTISALSRDGNIEVLEALLQNKLPSELRQELSFRVTQIRSNQRTRVEIPNPNVHERRHEIFRR